MSRELVKELTLDEFSYTITMLNADEGLKLLTKLTKLIGKPLMELSKTQADQANALEHIKNAVGLLTEKMDEDEVLSLIKRLLDCVIMKGDGSMSVKTKFNTHFRGRLGHLFKLLVEVVNHNFSDFLDVLPLANQSAGAVQKSP